MEQWIFGVLRKSLKLREDSPPRGNGQRGPLFGRQKRHLSVLRNQIPFENDDDIGDNFDAG